jgi:hypothetical protein
MLYLPAVRRAVLGHHGLSRRHAALGVLASPPYDLAFLANYARGLALRHRRRPAAPPTSLSSPNPEETHA